MKKNMLLICNGLSGSGKTHFIENTLGDLVYNLKSFTTRPMRNGEIWGEKYYYVDEGDFEKQAMATNLFVNEFLWKPGDKKWLYGVPEFEVFSNLGKNMVYDVIQPRYTRQLIDWFRDNNLMQEYAIRVLWFLPPTNSTQTVAERANMPNDTHVRANNTCDAIDFLRAGVQPDYILKSSREETIIPKELTSLIRRMRNIDATPSGYVLPDICLGEYQRRAMREMTRAKEVQK